MLIEQANRTEDEKWKSAYALFERAMEFPAAERLAFTERCSEDPAVVRLVLELLEAEPSDGATPHYTARVGRAPSRHLGSVQYSTAITQVRRSSWQSRRLSTR